MFDARADRFLFPGVVRIHLVRMGDHVGYLVMAISEWIDFLEGACA